MSKALIEQQIPLQARNTLRLPATAAWFARVTDDGAIPELLEWAREQDLPVLVLGGGSNVVLAEDFPGLVLSIDIRERHWQLIDNERAILTLGAGENWDATVRYACKAGYRGIENLALIPGTVGAAPVQNIGAYGVELRETLVDLEAWDREKGEFIVLSNEQCAFAYRDSLFKRSKDRFIITRIRLELSRSRPFTLSYGELASSYGHLNDPDNHLSPLDVAETVSQVRLRKLPDPARLPNAGSFFKNPVVDPDTFAAIREKDPEVVAYPDNQGYKLAAGWLIDRCGWKGYRETHVGVHSRQALVLIHHGQGTGRELLELAERIRADVQDRFGVSLEIEPRVIVNC